MWHEQQHCAQYMSKSERRLLTLLLIITLVVWAAMLANAYLLGPHGLNVPRYTNNVLTLAGAALTGFSLVALAAHTLRQWRDNRLAPPPSLSLVLDMDSRPFTPPSFIPTIIAPPTWAGLTPLESELFGFLNAYRHWPVHLENDAPDSLYDHALRLWDTVRQQPHTTPIHRVAALALPLAKLFAYTEHRTRAPWWHFTVQDQITYTRRCAEHGGLSALILSTLPSFQTLPTLDGEDTRQTLLTALRYAYESANLPANASPLTRDIVRVLNKITSETMPLS